MALSSKIAIINNIVYSYESYHVTHGPLVKKTAKFADKWVAYI